MAEIEVLVEGANTVILELPLTEIVTAAVNPVTTLEIPAVIGPVGPQGPQGIQGPIGLTGATGPKGDTGTAATVSVGTTNTLAAGASASVTNSGTSGAAVFNFSIPQGIQGIQGIQGPQGIKGDTGNAATIAVGTVNTGAAGSAATVTNSGTSSAATFNFSIPQGVQGVQGIQGVPGTAGALWWTGTGAPANGTGVINDMYLNTTNGDTYKKTGASAWTLQGNIRGPQGTQGIQGIQGVPGTAATITLGTVTTSAPGTNASITNSGNSTAATFNFTIPRGDQGIQGPQGEIGPQGPQGPPGSTLEAVFTNDDVAGVPVTSLGMAGQTGNLQEWRVGASVLARVSATGQIFEGSNRVYSAGNPQPMTGYATESYVTTQVNALVDAAPGTLDTLNELAAALGDDPNFATTMTNNLATKVSLTGDQTIDGTKTFGLAPVVPDSSFTLSKISATGTRNTTTFLRGDGTFAAPAYPVTSVNTRTGAVTGLAEANAVVDLTTAQTVAGVKTFSSIPVVPNASFTIAKLSTTGTASASTWLRGDGTWATLPADAVTSVNTRTGAVTGLAEANAVVDLTTAQTIAGIKTFSSIPVVPNASFGVAKLSATGTPSATTYLRGDNTWATLPPDAVTSVNTRTGAVTGLAEDNTVIHLAGTETISGAKTFSLAPIVPDASFTVAKISASGTRDATTYLRGDGTWAVVVSGVTSVNGRSGAVTGLAEANAVVDLTTAQTIAGIKTFSAIPVVPNASFGVAKLSATGTPSATTYLRGDNTWATITIPTVNDATTTTKGIVQLAGDLAGTATAPTVPGLATRQLTSEKNVAGGYVGLNADSLIAVAGIKYTIVWNGTSYPVPTRPAGTFREFIGPSDPNALGLMIDGDTWKDTTP